jgi:hypothetical protein
MKCAKCEMLNQIPETACSHCGRMMPALKPVFISKPEAEDDNAEQTETPEKETDAPAETEQAETTQEAEAEAVTLESGHVDNVGDESETPVP